MTTNTAPQAELEIPGVRPAEQARSRVLQDKFVKAGQKMLLEDRLSEISIPQIARRAKSSVGGFYSRFESKEAFFEFLRARMLQENGAFFAEALAPDVARGKSRQDLVALFADTVLQVFAGPWRGVLREAYAQIPERRGSWAPMRMRGREVREMLAHLLADHLPDTEETHARISFGVQLFYSALNNELMNSELPYSINDPAFRAYLIEVFDGLLSGGGKTAAPHPTSKPDSRQAAGATIPEEIPMPSIDDLKYTLLDATRRANETVATALPLGDSHDFDAAQKGLIARPPEGGVKTANGRVAWDIAKFGFLDGDCPPTVNPSLWRMARLNKIAGLFEVTEGVWQVRGFDYANMTVVRGESGWILVDPLIARETSAAALQLVNETLGERPVSAVLVTHTHPDHFGGLKGVVGDGRDTPPIYAPAHFMEYAASEGVLGGNHTSRRAIYQFGIILGEGPEGVVDGGIGKTVAKGSRTFVKPTEFVGRTGEERMIDGVRFIFQMASGTEAPAEFTFLLPDHRVLCMAEVCTQTMHNVLTPRGAQVRDALIWSRTIDEALSLFADRADTLINCHNWPVFGGDDIRSYLAEQRDIYKYIHDQTLRLANHGHTPNEIAALIAEPDWLCEKFHARGYYGTLRFNARAVYQRYYGFFDGNPVNLDPLSPTKLGGHIVEAIGGTEAALEVAREAVARDDLQWAATLLSHIVFSDADCADARALLAEVHRHQGYRAESAIMRNIYLAGAKELVEGVTPLPMAGGRNSDLAATLSLTDWFDAYALRFNAERARGHYFALNFVVDGRPVLLSVARQAEFARVDAQADAPAATVTLTQPMLERLSDGSATLDALMADGLTVEGNRATLQDWLDLHDSFDLWFDIVTP